ncbi:MAG: hypothetical protein M0P59_00295 [Gallionella sp.]|jgi:hypothetical protein|nr:hypothetical protein [Gallionella sp.]MCK9352579.1 hypothetical protein [Gallionella sp.]
MMDASFIKKLQPDPDGLDFDGLRKEGIRLVQEISGDVWTDYNLHDPGVTILEALCYGLTDLAYRSGFGAGDYLARDGGEIDFDKQALHRPDEIFSCRAVTDNDYRKLILDAVPNIDNVWVKRNSAETGGVQGLHFIYVQLSERVKNQGDVSVRKVYTDLIEKVYAANRNLCEDLAGVEIVERIPYALRGEIEIDGKREPDGILAEIYYVCAQYLSPTVAVHSSVEMYKSGHTLEALFDGVATAHGYIAEEALHPWRGQFSIPDLIGRVSRIDGVTNVRHLAFVDGQGNGHDCIRLGGEHSCLSVACLRFPLQDGADGVRLQRAGKAYRVSLRKVETEFERLEFQSQASRRHKRQFDWVEAMMPAADFRNVSEYFSIQNHFPDVYGLNAHGVPDSASPTRKAQAMQLKAYLLFFEQAMVNFLQNMQGIPELFSLDEPQVRTRPPQVLRSDVIPEVETLYANGVAQMEVDVAGLLAKFERYGDRRSRALDYLLGMYGEKLTLNSLRQFWEEGTDAEGERIEKKIAFLKGIVDIGKNRAAAFDYLKPADDSGNTAGLNKKLALLLGLKPSPDGASEQDRTGADIRIVEHILLRPRGESARNGHRIPDDFYNFRITVLFPAGPGCYADKDFRNLAEETVYLNCPAHIYPEIFWLAAGPMRRFEVLHEEWLKAKRQSGGADKTDAVAAQMILFLREIRKKNG